MRLMLASIAAFAAVALAAPSFAQEAAPTPTPSVKPKPGTTAYCNTLKSATSKSSCLKRVHAQAATPKAPAASTTHKPKPKKLDAAKTDTSAQLTPPPAAAPSPPQTVAIPALPQKTI